LDGGQCSFIRYNKEKDIWFCEIYDIRPIVCREYRCDEDNNDWDDWNAEEHFGEGYKDDYV